MNELQRARLALWHAAQPDEITALLAENAALLAENATLGIRLAASLERERQADEREREADRAVRDLLAIVNATPRGVLWSVWQLITGRDR
jgi:hypothetical protein